MSIVSDSQLDQIVRRLQLEKGIGTDPAELRKLQRQIDELDAIVVKRPDTVPTTRQGISNMLRNTDHNHSVNTWWETAPSATDKDKEAANVYAYSQIAPITITDAAITTGTAILTAPVSTPFTAAMVGRFVQVAGAGVAGATLVASIITFTSAGQVTLSGNAGTTVSGATARINLLKLTHTNKKNNAGANPNDALKDASHSQIATNISDPDWFKSSGIVRLGSLNAIGYPFGRFDNTGLVYAALHQLFAGREPFFRLNLARANRYVKLKGKLFVGIYNNLESALDWVKGSLFTLESVVEPPPSTTVSTDYVVAIETDQGYTLVSQVKNVTAPTDAAFAAGSRVTLSWTYFAGATQITVYRRRSAGNVFRMETFGTGTNSWTDVNLSTRVDTGVTTFPVFSNSVDRVQAYWASGDGEFDDLPYDGEPDRFWSPVEGRLPFPPTVNMAGVFDPHLIIGLTEPPATLVTDVVTNSTVNITSAANQFTAAMTGKNCTLTKSDGSAFIKTTFTHVSGTSGTLGTAAPWTENGSRLEIEDSQPRGILYDLVGVSLNEGDWDFHPEDNSELRGQPVASNPNGSTQGGTGGQNPTGGGGRGGIDCVLDEAMVSVRGRQRSRFEVWLRRKLSRQDCGNYRIVKKRADKVDVRIDLVWSGTGYTDDDFNEIDWKKVATVNEIRLLETETKALGCTDAHRVCSHPQSYKNGLRVSGLCQGELVLISDKKSRRLEAIRRLPIKRGQFVVVSFGLRQSKKRTACLLVINDIVCHNRKSDVPIIT